MKKGSALLIIVIIIGLLAALSSLFLRIVYNNYATANAVLQRTQAFYLAEAGLEKAKVELAQNPNWYTDLPYYQKDNVAWLINQAVGQKINLGNGSFKVIQEKNKDRLYSIGFRGKGIVVLKIENTKWEEI